MTITTTCTVDGREFEISGFLADGVDVALVDVDDVSLGESLDMWASAPLIAAIDAGDIDVRRAMFQARRAVAMHARGE
jgi:hypothetical protein